MSARMLFLIGASNADATFYADRARRLYLRMLDAAQGRPDRLWGETPVTTFGGFKRLEDYSYTHTVTV